MTHTQVRAEGPTQCGEIPEFADWTESTWVCWLALRKKAEQPVVDGHEQWVERSEHCGIRLQLFLSPSPAHTHNQGCSRDNSQPHSYDDLYQQRYFLDSRVVALRKGATAGRRRQLQLSGMGKPLGYPLSTTIHYSGQGHLAWPDQQRILFCFLPLDYISLHQVPQPHPPLPDVCFSTQYLRIRWPQIYF